MSEERMPFDTEDASSRLIMVFGAALQAMRDVTVGDEPGKQRSRAQMVQMAWESIPFVKALVVLGRNHPEELEREWRKALTEPMPFGGAPLGADYHPPPKREG